MMKAQIKTMCNEGLNSLADMDGESGLQQNGGVGFCLARKKESLLYNFSMPWVIRRAKNRSRKGVFLTVPLKMKANSKTGIAEPALQSVLSDCITKHACPVFHANPAAGMTLCIKRSQIVRSQL